MFTKPRFEFKYIASLNKINTLQERLKDVMFLDPNSNNGGYFVNSLYYDTQDLNCYYEKIDGEKRRFKFRIRWYGEIDKKTDLSKRKVFVEVKHRNNDMNYKNRVSVNANYLYKFLENQNRLLRLSETVDDKQTLEAKSIERISNQKSLFPICLVTYYRMPFICRVNPRLRVTFDIDLRVLGPKSIFQTTYENGAVVLPKDLCVIEIKFNWAMPIWLIEVCREMGLNLRRYSKYAASLENLLPQFAERSVRYQDPFP